MKSKKILGQEHIKKQLINSVDTGRIPHAQLFIGPEGCGTLPMAIGYANYVLGKQDNLDEIGSLDHPDLHFVYPTTSNSSIKKPTSKQFLSDWREFLNQSVYGNLYDWYNQLEDSNKQGKIGVDDAAEVMKTLSLKSYEGGYKIMIIWMADRMNTEASNKLLKLIEEPPAKTVFILISTSEENIIQTILSRCQIIHFNALAESAITKGLIEDENIEPNTAQRIAHQAHGNYNLALHYAHHDSEDTIFEKWFIQWVRTAFKAKGNKAVVLDLIAWSEEIASIGRETQKRFLNYCLAMFRQALMLNYQAPNLVYMETSTENFELKRFAPFVNGSNINEIYDEISGAIYHISRNGNQKLILTDLSLKLTRLIHRK